MYFNHFQDGSGKAGIVADVGINADAIAFIGDAMVHVIVNGTQILENREHTNARPRRIVRGSGYKEK